MPENNSSINPALEPEQDQDEEKDQPEAKETKDLSDEKVLEIIAGPLAASEEYWREYKDKYQRLENLYFGNIREDSPAKLLQSQLSSGDAFELVETILPRLIASKIRADLIGVEEGDQDPALLNEQILDWQFETQWLEQYFENWIRQAAKTVGALQVDYEVVPVKVWTKKRKYSMTLPFVNKQIGVGPMVEVQEVKEIARHILETIPWDQLIVSPATEMDKMPLIGKRVRKKVWELEKDDSYKNVDKIKQFLGEKLISGEGGEQYALERGDQQGVNWAVADQIVLDTEIEVDELYCRVEGCIHRVEIYPDTQVIIKNEQMDNWHDMVPIRLLSLVPVENQAIGLSPLETSESLIDAVDVWANILLETALFDVNRPIAYDKKNIGINWKVNPPKYAPGMALPVNGNPNNVFAVLAAPKIDGSHQWIMNWMKTRMQNKTGVTDYISGGDSVDQDQTLGAIQLKTSQSIKRFELSSKHVRRELSKVMFMMVSNNQQYMPDNYPVRILGQRGYQFKKVKSESIQGRFDYRVRGFESIATEEGQKIAKYRAMLVDTANPLVRPFINVYEIVKGLFEDGYNVGSGSKILITPQERLQDEDQQKQAQAMDANSENLDPQTAAVRPDDDHAVHLDIHMAFMKSPAFGQLPQPLQVMLARHIDAHRKVMASGGGMANVGQNPGPGGPPGAPPLQPAAPVRDLVRPSERNFTGQ